MTTRSTTFRNVIGGELVDSASGETYEVIDPTTGETYATAPLSGAEDVDRAYRAAEQAFESWAETTPAERQRALRRIADALEQRTGEFVRTESLDTGKPLGFTTSEELPPAIDQLRFFAGAARVLEGRSAGEYLADHTSFVRREPIGVVGQVTPWNYPLMMIAKIAPALADGNTLVLKPSDMTPASTTLFAEMVQEFLPPGVFNVVTGNRDTGRALVDHPTPQLVASTGSVRAGMQVATGVHDEFVAALSEQARGTSTGMPDDDDVLYGPLNNADQLARVSGMVDRLPDHATVSAGGHRQGDRGYFYEPAELSGLRQDDEQIQDEIFGPVITIQKCTDEAEALRWANGVRYGKDLSMYGLEDCTRLKHAMSYIGTGGEG